MPDDLDRLIVDHSPNGEFIPLLRHLASRSSPEPLIVEVGIDNAATTVSLESRQVAQLACHLDRIRSGTPRRNRIPVQRARLPVAPRRDIGPRERRRSGRGRECPARRAPAEPEGQRRGASPARIPDRNAFGSRRSRLFELLVIGAASNAVGVVNDLLSDRLFMPAVIVVTTDVPTDSAALEQLGLSTAVATSYDVVSTSPRSITLARIGGPPSSL